MRTRQDIELNKGFAPVFPNSRNKFTIDRNYLYYEEIIEY